LPKHSETVVEESLDNKAIKIVGDNKYHAKQD
jgi:hypothetical protein